MSYVEALEELFAWVSAHPDVAFWFGVLGFALFLLLFPVFRKKD